MRRSADDGVELVFGELLRIHVLRDHLLAARLLLLQLLVRAVVRVVALVVAVETRDHVVLLGGQDLLQVFVRNLLLLAVSRLVALHPALVALNLLLPSHVLLILHLRRLTMGPIEFIRHVGNSLQIALIRLENSLQVILRAVGPKRAKAKHVVFANGLVLHIMIENAFVSKLTKSSLPIWALLALFCVYECASLVGGVSVNALLIGAISFLLPELTNWHFRFVVYMQKVAIVASGALLLEPVHTDQLLALCVLNIIMQTLVNGGQLVDRLNLLVINRQVEVLAIVRALGIALVLTLH